MSKTHTYNPHLAMAHQKAVEDAVNADTPRARFAQAMQAMKKNIDSLPTAEAKVAAIDHAFAHQFEEITEGIFDVTR